MGREFSVGIVQEEFSAKRELSGGCFHDNTNLVKYYINLININRKEEGFRGYF